MHLLAGWGVLSIMNSAAYVCSCIHPLDHIRVSVQCLPRNKINGPQKCLCLALALTVTPFSERPPSLPPVYESCPCSKYNRRFTLFILSFLVSRNQVWPSFTFVLLPKAGNIFILFDYLIILSNEVTKFLSVFLLKLFNFSFLIYRLGFFFNIYWIKVLCSLCVLRISFSTLCFYGLKVTLLLISDPLFYVIRSHWSLCLSGQCLVY